MKAVLILTMLFMVGITKVQSQNIKETTSYLETMIKSNPPLKNYKTIFKYDEIDDKIKYEKEVSYDNGGWAYTITYYIPFSKIENVLLTKEDQNAGEFYQLAFSLADESGYLLSRGKLAGEKDDFVDKFSIYLRNDKENAQKVKNAIMHLAKIKGYEIKDLDMF